MHNILFLKLLLIEKKGYRTTKKESCKSEAKVKVKNRGLVDDFVCKKEKSTYFMIIVIISSTLRQRIHT